MLNQVRRTAFLTITGLGVALASQATISRAFGTSRELDDYWLAYSVSMLVTFFVAPFRDALGAEFAKRITSDPTNACEHINSILCWIIRIFLLMMLVLMGAALAVGSLTARNNLAWLLCVFSIGIPAYASAECLSGLLLAISKPAYQQALRLLLPTVNIIVVLVAGRLLGPLALAIGFALAHTLIVIAAMTFLRFSGFRLGWMKPQPPNKTFLKATSALAFNAFLIAVYLVLDKFVFNQLRVGAASAFQYAVAVTNVLITIAGGVAATTIDPHRLHDAHRSGQAWSWTVKILFALCGLFFVLIPIWLAADPIVAVLFSGKHFTPEAQSLTVSMLRAAIFTAFPASIVMVGMRFAVLLSHHKSIAVSGIVIALTGTAVIVLGWILKSPTIVSLHWLAANLAGAISISFILRQLYSKQRFAYMDQTEIARSAATSPGGMK